MSYNKPSLPTSQSDAAGLYLQTSNEKELNV